MKLTRGELEFLAAWAREEWEAECYRLPAHRLQLSHQVSGAHLIRFIKAWTEAEDKKDQDIANAAVKGEPVWPWGSDVEFHARLEETQRTKREVLVP